MKGIIVGSSVTLWMKTMDKLEMHMKSASDTAIVDSMRLNARTLELSSTVLYLIYLHGICLPARSYLRLADAESTTWFPHVADPGFGRGQMKQTAILVGPAKAVSCEQLRACCSLIEAI